MDIKHVLVVGAGTMGSQISLDCALAGYSVTVWDQDDQALASMNKRHKMWIQWQVEKKTTTNEAAEKALTRIKKETDAVTAGKKADLLIEAVYEDLEVKQKVFEDFEQICPLETILVTNTSTLLPSQIETRIKRKEQFSAFHFNWPKTVIEIMRGTKTSDETVGILKDFSRRIGYLPIYIKREFPGYVHASLFAAWAITGLQLAALDVASIEDIDRTWMRGDETPLGPLGALDHVGLDLAYAILQQMQTNKIPGFDYSSMMAFIEPYIQRNELGVKTEKGFYDYPDPAYRRQDFLK